MPIQYDQIPVASVPQAPIQQTPVNPTAPGATPPTLQVPPHPVKKLLLAEIVFAEVIFGIFVVCFIFGVLNYFNIISLGKSFSFLAGLPHQELPQPIATPFQYNKEGANGQVRQYIQTTLKPEFQPADVFSQGSITAQSDNVFTKNWSVSQIIFNTQFSFEPQTSTESYLSLQISGQLTAPLKENDTAAVAALLAKFLITPASPSALLCSPTTHGNACSQFSNDPTGKSGQAVAWDDTSFTIFSCYVPRNTVSHAADATCVISN